ncbi:PREDICTED: uncharacterized protein LOC109180781 [Ipomoea nil]|uniref:uncharacterized protein LOC109180781 n=1 Tax=Ipomoea nil TaxID=35883 RepID=UPI000900EC68|nr:PREDICTED: uncharacterized protein LOC109180781 [Ipomoea nil]
MNSLISYSIFLLPFTVCFMFVHILMLMLLSCSEFGLVAFNPRNYLKVKWLSELHKVPYQRMMTSSEKRSWVDCETLVGVFADRDIEVGEPLTYDYRVLLCIS